MIYTDYKRDLAVRIVRRLGHKVDDSFHAAVATVMETFDEFLPVSEHDCDFAPPSNGKFSDLTVVYEVECSECDTYQHYTHEHAFGTKCGNNFD